MNQCLLNIQKFLTSFCELKEMLNRNHVELTRESHRKINNKEMPEHYEELFNKIIHFCDLDDC